MPKKHCIAFEKVSTPITEPVTKFGGQPVWISDPQWPVSREKKQKRRENAALQNCNWKNTPLRDLAGLRSANAGAEYEHAAKRNTFIASVWTQDALNGSSARAPLRKAFASRLA